MTLPRCRQLPVSATQSVPPRRIPTLSPELRRDSDMTAAVAGRALLLGARFAPAAIAGTALLSLSKVLENMEIGHNVMHGQWDWMRDPAIHSSGWEWDAASTAASWKHAHNFQHHTYTNVLG